MIKVEMELYDDVEAKGFANFVTHVQNYRTGAGLARPQEPVAEAQYSAPAPSDPAVVGAITPKPESPKAPPEGDINTAATAFLRKHGNAVGVPKLLDLLKQFGVSSVKDVTDPGKRAELYTALVEGAK